MGAAHRSAPRTPDQWRANAFFALAVMGGNARSAGTTNGLARSRRRGREPRSSDRPDRTARRPEGDGESGHKSFCAKASKGLPKRPVSRGRNGDREDSPPIWRRQPSGRKRRPEPSGFPPTPRRFRGSSTAKDTNSFQTRRSARERSSFERDAKIISAF